MSCEGAAWRQGTQLAGTVTCGTFVHAPWRALCRTEKGIMLRRNAVMDQARTRPIRAHMFDNHETHALLVSIPYSHVARRCRHRRPGRCLGHGCQPQVRRTCCSAACLLCHLQNLWLAGACASAEACGAGGQKWPGWTNFRLRVCGGCTQRGVWHG